MKIKTFRLMGNNNIYNQVIVGGSEMKIILEIYNFNKVNIEIDISNYSQKKIIKLKRKGIRGDVSFFSETFIVDFLGDKGMLCKKNNSNTRVFMKNNNLLYFSNSIGNYEYLEDFIINDKKNINFETCDHHLGVYNKYENNYKEKSNELSEYNKYDNDIIFFDRGTEGIETFINLNLNLNNIFKKYLYNLLKSRKSIFYLNIFIKERHINISNKILKIILLCKKGTYYFYNIESKYLEKNNINKKYFLYNYHFPPIFNKYK